MATNLGSKDVAFFLVGGRDVLGAQTALTVESEAKVVDTTPFGVTWQEFMDTGSRSAVITQDGWYDAAANASNAALCEREGTAQVVCIGLGGNTVGARMAATGGGFAAKYGRILEALGLHKAKAEYTISTGLETPVILKAYGSITGDGNTQATSVDNAASSADGGAAYLQVSALTLGGYTDLTVKVRHSSDNNTFTDLVTMTAVTTAPTAERKTVASTVNRYLAASYAFSGSGGAHSASVVVGFARA